MRTLGSSQGLNLEVRTMFRFWKLAMAIVVALIFVLSLSPAVDLLASRSPDLTANPVAQTSQLQPVSRTEWLRSPVRSQGQDRRSDLLRFACVQLPVKCSSNSDCTCSSCCGQWSGSSGICQPSC